MTATLGSAAGGNLSKHTNLVAHLLGTLVFALIMVF